MDDSPADEGVVRDTNRLLHQTIRKCYNDLDRFKFNTAIASLHQFTNHLNQVWADGTIDAKTWRECTEKLLLMLAPMAPHMTEELWEMNGHPYSIHQQSFPSWDDNLTAEDTITLIVNVTDKVGDKIRVSVGF